MRYLKTFEIVSNVRKRYDKHVYWLSQVKDLVNRDWYDLSTEKGNPNTIKFLVDYPDKEYDYRCYIYIERPGNEDDIMVEDDAKSLLAKKCKEEFLKNPEENVKNFKFDPKFLGDLQMYRDTKKFNL